jgi:hypothetical protein
VDEVQEEETLPFLNHCRKILKQVVNGAEKGQEVFHSCVEENFPFYFIKRLLVLHLQRKKL